MSSSVRVNAERELARFDLGRGEFLIIRDVEYAGAAGRRLDVRKFYTDDAEELKPTSKGASLKPAMLTDLRRALDAFEAAK